MKLPNVIVVCALREIGYLLKLLKVYGISLSLRGDFCILPKVK